MINIKDFDPNLLKIDKKSHKNIYIYYIGYITVKDSYHVKINSVNPLYLIVSEADGYIKEKNGSKCLAFDSANENTEVLKKYSKLWDGIKHEIETINGSKASKRNSAEYDKGFIKIKFNSNDNLLLNKTLKLHNIIIVI